MPYANNHGIRIHYQVEGEGPPLVLQHGSTSSLQAGLTSAERKRIIWPLNDYLPANGGNSRPCRGSN